MSNHLIIIGASARAAAQSAIRAGYSPWCIDLFADRDLQAIAPVKRCPREKWPAGVLELMHDAPPGPVLFTGAMENHIELIKAIAAGRTLFCGSVAAAERVRSPFAMRRAWDDFLDKCARDRVLPPQLPALCLVSDRPPWHARFTWPLRRLTGAPTFLIKPRRSAGGHGVRFWSCWRRCTRDEYIQQFIPGTPMSAVFGVYEGRVALIGASEQLIGDAEYGASAFEYCGNIGPMRLTTAMKQQWEFIGNAMVEWALLDGVFGIDAVLSAAGHRRLNPGKVVPVEVNPRYTASVELYERAAQASVLTLPQRCEGSPLPLEPEAVGFHGKAILRARRRCRVPDLYDAVEAESIADVPEIGQLIDTGEPVCTVFASGESRAACEDRLRLTAQRVYTRLQPA